MMCIRPLRGGFRYTANAWMLMPVQGVECGWKPGGWPVATALNSKNPFPPPAPGANFLQYKHKRFRSILRTILSKPGKTSMHTCLGAGAGATLLASTYTYTPNIRIQLPPSRQIFSKTHIWGWGWGWGLGLGHELRNRAPCNNGSRSAKRLASD